MKSVGVNVAMKIQITTGLSREACKEKLLSHIDTGLGASWYSIGPIVGTIKGDNIVIQKRTAFFTNSFGRFFYGRMTSENHKTIIEGQFKLFTPIKWLLGITFIVYLVMFSMLIYGISISPALTEELIFGFLGMIGMFIFACAIYAFGRFRSLAEEEYLVELLRSILEGASR